jgi:hypothetical protein
MPSLNLKHTAPTRTAAEDVLFRTWHCSIEDGSITSADGTQLQTYGTAEGTDFSHFTWNAKQKVVQGCQVIWTQEPTEHTALHAVLQRTPALHYDTV